MSDVIDWAHLERQTMGEDAIAREVLGLFVTQLEEALSGFCSEDEKLSDKVHKLKGSARGVGAWPIAQIAERFAEPQADVAKDLVELKQAMERAHAIVCEKLGQF